LILKDIKNHFKEKTEIILLPSNGKNVTSILHDDRNFAGGGQKT
jgi:hypothetical protein